jgi:hypothetical protein
MICLLSILASGAGGGPVQPDPAVFLVILNENENQ